MNGRPLHLVMRELVDAYGKDIVCDYKLRGLLADELGTSFKEYRSLIQLAELLGIGKAMYDMANRPNEWALHIKKQKQAFALASKLDRVLSDYVVDSFAFALRYVATVRKPSLEGTLAGLTQQIAALERENESNLQKSRETVHYSQVALGNARRVRRFGVSLTLVGAALLALVTYFILFDNGRIPRDPKHKMEKLLEASEAGDAKYVAELLQNDAYVNSRDAEGNTPLHYAVKIGSAELVDTLLQHKADETVMNNLGRTPIELALELGNVYYVNIFVRSHSHAWMQANYERLKKLAVGQQGLSLLQEARDKIDQIRKAIKDCDVKALERNLAFRNGLDLYYKENDGKTLLHYAAQNANVAVLKYLISKGLNAEAADNAGELPENLAKNAANKNYLNHYRLKNQLIFEAVKKGNMALLDEVIGYGASVNAIDSDGIPLVHYAAKRGTAMLEHLKKLGADISVRNRYNESVLFAAVQQNDLALAKKLLVYGFSVHDKNIHAQTPMTIANNKTSKFLYDYTYRDSLFVAAVKHKNLNQADYYLQLGADVNYVSNDRHFAAIHFAVENDDARALDFLKENGASMTLLYANATPVEMALLKRKKNAFQNLLVNDMAAVSRIGASGKTLMHMACDMSGSDTWINMLLAKGAKVDAFDRNGKTPLAYSIQRNNKERVAFLLKKGADARRTDSEGNNSLHVAARYAGGRIVKMLVDAGADPSVENNAGDKPVDIAEDVQNESAQDELDNYSLFGKARKKLKSAKNAGSKLWGKFKGLAS